MAVIETWVNQDLQEPVKVQYLKGNVFSADNNGNLVGVKVFDGGETASLTGSVSASIIRADGATVAVSGTLSGNECSVVLPQTAYAVPGHISIVIKLTSGTTITTLAAVVAVVYESTTDTVVDPGTIIPSVQTLISQIETAVASIPADYSSLWTSLAPAYSTSATYAVGQYVTYNGAVYRCTTAITAAESWTSGHWTNINIGSELTNLNTAINHCEILNTKSLRWTSDNYVNWENGNFSSLGGVSRTDKIAIGTHKRFVIKVAEHNDSRGIAFYNASGTFISGVQYLSGQSAYSPSIPEGAEYFAFCDDTTRVSEGETIFYWADDYSLFKDFMEGEIVYTPSITWTNGYRNASSGVISSITGCSASNLIPVKYFKKAVLLVKGYGDLRGICYYDKDRTFISGMQYNIGYCDYTLTFPNNTEYVALTCDTQDVDTEYFKFVFTGSIEAMDAHIEEIEKHNSYIPNIDWYNGRYWSVEDGQLKSYSGASASPLMKLQGANRIFVSISTQTNDSRGIVFWDMHGDYISGVAYVSGQTEYIVDVPSTAFFVGISKYVDDNNVVVRFNWGSNKYTDDIYDEKYVSSLITMFENVGFCGDSYTKSQIYNEQGESLGYWEKSGYPAVMGRYFGITPTVFARGGATTSSWLDDEWGLTAALAADPQDLYILAFGINDKTYVAQGTISDITSDYTQNPDTFYGNYGKIIEQLQAHAPNAKFIIVKSFIPVDDFGIVMGYYEYSDTACEEIAEHYGFPYLETMTSDFFSSKEWVNGRYGGHPTAPLYAAMGKEIGRMIGKCIFDNYEYFADFMKQ